MRRRGTDASPAPSTTPLIDPRIASPAPWMTCGCRAEQQRAMAQSDQHGSDATSQEGRERERRRTPKTPLSPSPARLPVEVAELVAVVEVVGAVVVVVV